jgi:hypothetical protein
MISFTPTEIQELLKGPRFLDLPTERECPACGAVSVRTYMYEFEGAPGRPSIISYTWCASCRRASGVTGTRPRGLTFTDPLESMSRAERLELSRSGGLFDLLDRLWDEGRLPQKFGRDTTQA